jgi:EAL domain-containing protein (putative c-di-GMP-specific phosphodiesterase class I)
LATSSQRKVGNKRGCVLLVEDDAFQLRLFRRLLEDAGFEIVVAANGKEAIAKIEANSFDVILSDILMRDIDGIDLLRAVRQRNTDVPVLLMTGGPELTSAVKAVEYGALRYMEKPFKPNELVNAVREASTLHALALLKREALALAGDGVHQPRDRVALESNLVAALESLWMAFQPVVSWSGKRAIAYEALLRSSNAVLTNPGAVLEAAEELDRLNDVGRAVRACVARVVANAPVPDIFVNVHSQDLMDDHLYDATAPLSLAASRIVLEITERASLEKVTDVSERIRRLRGLGYRIAIDDLGAGYAGLSSFSLLHPDMVKIDMSLVRGIETSTTKQRLVASMTALCLDMGMSVICEGIETAGERDVITGLGCDLLQGYLIARPAAGVPDPRY